MTQGCNNNPALWISDSRHVNSWLSFQLASLPYRLWTSPPTITWANASKSIPIDRPVSTYLSVNTCLSTCSWFCFSRDLRLIHHASRVRPSDPPHLDSEKWPFLRSCYLGRRHKFQSLGHMSLRASQIWIQRNGSLHSPRDFPKGHECPGSRKERETAGLPPPPPGPTPGSSHGARGSAARCPSKAFLPRSPWILSAHLPWQLL